MRGKEAQRFLGLLPPVDLSDPENYRQLDRLKQNLATMLDGHSWLDLLVKCYSVKPPPSVQSQTKLRYKVVATAANFAAK